VGGRDGRRRRTRGVIWAVVARAGAGTGRQAAGPCRLGSWGVAFGLVVAVI
jgi:hypothetical protein